MSGLDDIAVEVVAATDANGHTGQLLAILSELKSMLIELQQTGKPNSIDLRSLPMFPGDYDRLKLVLGEGEVSARISTLGDSLIQETTIPGIWWVTHFNTDDETIAEFIEVTLLPDLLKTQTEDLAQADQQLDHLLSQLTTEE
jgi:hydrogenase-1 operon protein HyaF